MKAIRFFSGSSCRVDDRQRQSRSAGFPDQLLGAGVGSGSDRNDQAG